MKRGAYVNVQDYYGETPLIIAASLQNEQILKKLLEVPGVDLNLKTIIGESTLSYAIFREDEEIVISLINAGASVNDRDMYWNTPLMVSVKRGNIPITRLLLSVPGIRVNANNALQKSILGEAICGGNAILVDLLIKAGADVHQKSLGITPLNIAIRFGNSIIIELLSNAIANE